MPAGKRNDKSGLDERDLVLKADASQACRPERDSREHRDRHIVSRCETRDNRRTDQTEGRQRKRRDLNWMCRHVITSSHAFFPTENFRTIFELE